MADIFDQLAGGQTPSATTPPTQSAPAPASTGPNDIFSQLSTGGNSPDLPNPNREGTYSLRDASGKVVNAPYSKVPDLAKQGYQFNSDDERFRFAKDQAADPNAKVSYAPTNAESTPEGGAAAQQARENASTTDQIASGVGKGSGDVLGMLNPVGVLKSAWNSFAPVAAYKSIQHSLPALDAYEKARSNGASVTDALSAANQKAAEQDQIRQLVKERAQEFHDNPTQATARAVTDVAGLIGTFYATHGAAPEVEAGGAEETAIPAAEDASAKPGLLTQIKKPFSLKAVQEALQTSKDSVQQALQSNLQNIQDAWHGSLRDLFDDVASEAGVKPEPAQSLRDVASNTAAAVKSKASAMYKQLDEAIGGGTRFQTFDEQINTVKRALRNDTGVDHDYTGRLIERINDLEDAKAAALEQAKAAGVDPKLIDQANAAWRQASALEDVSKHLQASTSGLRGDLAQGVKAAPEAISPAKLAPRANRLYNTGRLQQALGDDRADELLRYIERTKQQAQDAAETAAQQTDAATANAAQRTAAVRRNQVIGGTIAASAGAPTVLSWLKHLLGE